MLSCAVHVGLHRVDWLWNVHKVHHSTLELDGFATTRTHMVENLLRFVPSQALLFLIGMPVTVVAASVAVAGRDRGLDEEPRHPVVGGLGSAGSAMCARSR